METVIIPKQIVDVDAIEQLSIEQKLHIIETLQNSIAGSYTTWLDGRGDDDDQHIDDITLAEEAMAEYIVNPTGALNWDDFYKLEMQRLKDKAAC